MNIEFTMQEYFNQLKLMDEQYGQEEDLYPWIYMLLQMAECRKQRIQKERYSSVSIRDVHAWKRKKLNNKVEPKRKKILDTLYMQRGTPEIVFIDADTDAFLGCVEVKNYKSKTGKYQSLNISSCGECVTTGNGYEVYECKLYFEKNEEVKEELKEEIEKKLDEKIREKSNEIIRITVGSGQQQNARCDYCKIVSKNSINEIIKEGILPEGLKIARVDEKKIYQYNEEDGNNKLGWYETSQIISHLEKFKKVLYTNGLEFYYLILKDSNSAQKIIDVRELADLHESYNSFKNNSHSLNLVLEATAEWDKLIAGLVGINWHNAPIAPI